MNPFILRKPVVTEKSVRLAETARAYTFEVDRTAHKEQIAAAVKQVYGVDVVHVRTTTSQAVARRTGKKRMTSQTAKVKKAIVTIAPGQSIDVFDVTGSAA